VKIESLYYYTSSRLNRLYREKNRGLITPEQFAKEQRMILLEFASGVQDDIYEKLKEDAEERKLLKIESELD
jgi:hypothetical protein